MTKAEFYLEDLKSKFLKINPKQYYLSYSGGRDSHLLYWFLKIWLYDNDIKMWLRFRHIPIIGCNTRMEYPEILRRIIKNSDKVLLPELKPQQIKEKYGSPCFSKSQDEFIKRYQNGLRSESLMARINGNEKQYNINNRARTLLLSGKLHKVSPKCCEYLKKKPFKIYEKQTKRFAILGVRADEGVLRKTQYTSCFNKNGKFTPIWDLDEETFNEIYKIYSIETPTIYKTIDRTGCIGCPYGRQQGYDTALLYASDARIAFIETYFKESYEAKGIQTNNKQMRLNLGGKQNDTRT